MEVLRSLQPLQSSASICSAEQFSYRSTPAQCVFLASLAAPCYRALLAAGSYAGYKAVMHVNAGLTLLFIAVARIDTPQ